MDSITHVLSAALWTEPVPSPHLDGAGYARWRERMAVVLAALLPDADGLIGLPDVAGITDGAFYAQYHRVVTHSVGGFLVAALLAATIAQRWPARWLFPSLRPRPAGLPVADPLWRRLFAFSLVSVFWHFAGDSVTAWGILKLLWPFSSMDFQLKRVNSIEPVLLCFTVAAWAIQNQCLRHGRRKTAWAVAAVWLALCALYVWLRPLFGSPAFV